MISFTPYENFTHYLIITIWYCVTILLFWKHNIKEYHSYDRRQPLLVLFFLLHLLFAFDGGDFYHYYIHVLFEDYSTMEPVYSIIGRLVGNNYLLFRLIIWGTAFFLFFQTAKRFGLDPYKTTYLLYLMFITVFDYARATLGMAFFFFGMSFLCVPSYRHRFLSYLLGYLFIFASVMFHRSLLFCVAISFIVFIPLNKKTIILFLIILALSIPVLNSILSYILSGSLITDVSINEKMAEYAQQEAIRQFSRYEWIRRYLHYATFFIPVIVCYFKLLGKEDQVSDPSRYHSMVMLFLIAFGIQVLAVSSLILDLESFVLFYRYLYMSMIPIVILLCYMRDEQLISSKLFMSIILLALACKFFGIAKRFMGGNFA